MAGDWMKIEKDTPEKPEVYYIAEKLNITLGDAFLACFRVWRWADTHTPDGHAPHVPPGAVDTLALTPGLSQALIEVGWLQVRTGALEIPRFDRHMGQSAKKRLDAAERQQRYRSRVRHELVTDRESIPRGMRRTILSRDDQTCVYCGFKAGTRAPAGPLVGVVISLDHVIPVCKGGVTSPENLVTCCTACNGQKSGRTPEEAGMVARYVTSACDAEVTAALPREEKRREEKSKEEPPKPPYGSEAFRHAWEDWVQHRKEKGVKLTPLAIRKQFKLLAEMGEPRALAAIEFSIAQCYQGIFEPTAGKAKPPPVARKVESKDETARKLAEMREYEAKAAAEAKTGVRPLLNGIFKPAE